MSQPAFVGGINIAMKIPRAEYEATVAFYRDDLGFDVEHQETSSTPTISRSCSLRFGPTTLWLDCVDTYPRSDLWLEVRTDDLAGATAALRAADVRVCDEVEPIEDSPFASHWIKNPAGVVHLLIEDPGVKG